MSDLRKFILSPVGLVVCGLALLGLTMMVGRIMGASFFFIAGVTIFSLVFLTVYLVFHLVGYKPFNHFHARILSTEENQPKEREE